MSHPALNAASLAAPVLMIAAGFATVPNAPPVRDASPLSTPPIVRYDVPANDPLPSLLPAYPRADTASTIPDPPGPVRETPMAADAPAVGSDGMVCEGGVCYLPGATMPGGRVVGQPAVPCMCDVTGVCTCPPGQCPCPNCPHNTASGMTPAVTSYPPPMRSAQPVVRMEMQNVLVDCPTCPSGKAWARRAVPVTSYQAAYQGPSCGTDVTFGPTYQATCGTDVTYSAGPTCGSDGYGATVYRGPTTYTTYGVATSRPRLFGGWRLFGGLFSGGR